MNLLLRDTLAEQEMQSIVTAVGNNRPHFQFLGNVAEICRKAIMAKAWPNFHPIVAEERRQEMLSNLIPTDYYITSVSDRKVIVEL